MDATQIFEMIKQAFQGDTLNQIIIPILIFLKIPVKDALQDIIKKKIGDFFSKNNNNSTIDDLTTALKEIPELQNITNYDMSIAFTNTFGDVNNSLIAIAPNNSIFLKDCEITIGQRKNEMGTFIEDIIKGLGKDLKDIKDSPALISTINKAIVESYNYDEKKDHLKNLIKERIEKSINDDFMEMRAYDQAIEIVSQLSKEELNILAICSLAVSEFPDSPQTYHLNTQEKEKLCTKSYIHYISLFLPIDSIKRTTTTSTFAKYGFILSGSVYSKPLFLYLSENKNKSLLDQILLDPKMSNLKSYIDLLKQYLAVYQNHHVFQIIAQNYIVPILKNNPFSVNLQDL